MKITFIGTSHGYPETGRKLSCTMLEIGDSIYFIDAGAPLAQYVVDRQMDRKNIKALFITHMHSDHFGGAFCFLGCINDFWTDTCLDVVLPEERAISMAYQMMLEDNPDVDHQRLHFFNLKDKPFYEDENLRLTAIPNQHTHGKMKSFSFYIEAEGKRVLFTGDLTSELTDFPHIAFGQESLDLIVCEYAHSKYGYMDPVVGKVNTRRLYFNHVYPHAPKFQEIEAWNERHGFDIRHVQDDDEFCI